MEVISNKEKKRIAKQSKEDNKKFKTSKRKSKLQNSKRHTSSEDALRLIGMSQSQREEYYRNKSSVTISKPKVVKPTREIDKYLDPYNLSGKDINHNRNKIATAIKFSKENAKNPTHAESILKSFFDKEMVSYEFQKIVYIDDKLVIRKFYLPDFYLPKYNLIIELDGGYHDNSVQSEMDWLRTQDLMKAGYFVIRFDNSEVNNLELLKQKILFNVNKFKMTGRKCKYKG